jgi:hypothetical protein
VDRVVSSFLVRDPAGASTHGSYIAAFDTVKNEQKRDNGSKNPSTIMLNPMFSNPISLNLALASRRRMRHSVIIGLCALAIFIPACTLRADAQNPTKDAVHRLILKDGTYQLVTKYEIKGDRVHYYSTEREEWEDLPNSLVDWPATDNYEKQRASMAASPEAVQLDKEAAEEEEREEKPLPQVAPGLRLPEDSGVFLLETFQGGPQLVELHQSEGDVGRGSKGSSLRAAIIPMAGVKENIALEGAHAGVQSHVAVPTLYISADSSNESSEQIGLVPNRPDSRPGAQPQQPEQPEQALVPYDRFRIVRAEVKNGNRILGDLKRSATGKMSQEQHFVKTTITDIAGGWFKVTPAEDLAPGEYALVEMMGKDGMNLYVWDFGVNAKAPANANTWKPEVKAAKPDADKAEPEVQSH